MKIKIVDSIMGSGKTSWAIQRMNEKTNQNYIYITPFLREVDRIKSSVKNKRFFDPKNLGEGKLDSLHKLILDGKNIASTHALFKMATEETIGLLRANNYTLILDEVMDVVEEVPLNKNDLELLFGSDMIRVDKDNNNLVIWNEDKLDWDTKYNSLRNQCLSKNVFMVNNTLLMWTFPIEVFKSFRNVYVLTYMFNGQLQKYYYDIYNLEYEYFSVHEIDGKYVLGQYIENYDLQDIKSKINIIDDNINLVGDSKTALSMNWFDRQGNKLLIQQLKKNLNNYFRNKLKSKSTDNMWTTFKEYESKLVGKGYTKGFVSINSRATNDYAYKSNLAYCGNRFMNPYIKQFFLDRGVKINEDVFALSELIQWIWRSRIRNGEPINLYIPSKRMRELLTGWLDGEIK